MEGKEVLEENYVLGNKITFVILDTGNPQPVLVFNVKNEGNKDIGSKHSTC